VTRRAWLLLAGSAASVGAAESEESRILDLVEAYGNQGIHRTGTAVDKASAEWLGSEVRRRGLTPQLEPFVLSRVEPVTGAVIADGRRVEGMPLFDGTFTDGAGIKGRIAVLSTDGEIGFRETVPNAADTGALGTARRLGAFKAIVCITRGGQPGLCPSNADFFREPFGPPVLQVSSTESDWLKDLVKRNADVQVIAEVRRTPAEALNVTAKITGARADLLPLVVMTPRSGWYSCASERGGGIVCWLELITALRAAKPARDVLFVASSGHELGHLGINAFVDKRPGIVKHSVAWIHLGANIGAAADPGNTLQASDNEIEEVWANAMTVAGLSITRRNPRGTVPGGEAEVVHRGGGRYISVIGRNALFHNPDDRGRQTVDAAVIARFVDALTGIATRLAS
jgi:hypothetical protein